MQQQDSNRPTTITQTCPAKINLALSVGSPDPRGYHPIASWMVTLTFGDELTLTHLPSESPSTFDITFAPDAPVPQPIDWPLEKDLAYRAHELLQQHVGRLLNVHATIAKKIPAGAGLGGGSSDAAAMLVALNRLFELDVDSQTLCTLAGQLGSDVVFLTAALLGTPSALVTGTGEKITSAPMTEPIDLVLIFPGVGCPTGPVYAAFDRQPTSLKTADEQAVRALLQMHPLPPDAPFNDLAEPACSVQPVLHELRQQCQVVADLPIHVTGSGSTLFAVAPDAQRAATIAQRITQTIGRPAIAAQTRQS